MEQLALCGNILLTLYFTINSLVLNKSGSGVVRDFVLSSVGGDGSGVGEEVG